MSADYLKIKYKVVELPSGPKGPGTLEFTNCWGIAADSHNKAAAQKLVERLTTPKDQISFAKAFGVMPSVTSAADEFKKAFPAEDAFLAGVSYAQSLPAQAGAADVIKDFDAELASLKTADPKALLDAVQADMTEVAGT
ncbi:hypothetical protein [Paenarthrobacter sp. Z7-10]|uniref:hypothetical protein n=1 Tax=Paenarthrobacter sp. Z7-10 TaxID=2787635 RepID=UPI0022A99DBA|nr:hypothetical protein [Paenarthrobacter sp. Z7-10]